MARAYAWNFDENRTYTPSTLADLTKWTVWYLHARLMGHVAGTGGTAGLWTCVGSSDGATAGLDGVDRWGSTYDPSKLVQSNGVAGVARSWAVWSRMINGMTWYLTVSLNAGPGQGSIWFSKTSPSGGSATANPTQATDALNLTTSYIDNAPANARTFLLNMSSRGDFVLAIRDSTTALWQFGIIVMGVETPKAADAWPMFVRVAYATTGIFHSNPLFVETGGMSRNAANSAASTSALVYPFASNVAPLDFSGADTTDGSVPLASVATTIGSAGSYSVRGLLPDLRGVPVTASDVACVPQGSYTRDADGNIEYVIIGSIAIPGSAAPSGGGLAPVQITPFEINMPPRTVYVDVPVPVVIDSVAVTVQDRTALTVTVED